MRAAALVGAALLVGATAGQATTYRVPEDQPTVLAALDLAVAGDSVLVGPGIWMERETRSILVFGGISPVRANGFIRAGVTLIGAGSEQTVLQADAEGGAGVLLQMLALANQGAPGVVEIRGVTLRGLGQYYVPLRVDSCDLVIRDAVLENLGFAIDIDDGDVTLQRCAFRDNDASGFSSQVVGIQQHEGRVTVEDCLFERNRGSMLFSMTLPVAASGTFRRNTIRGNWATVLTATEVYLLTFEDNLVVGNVPSSSAALLTADDCRGAISRNTFAFNTAGSPNGTSIIYNDFLADIVGNTFYGNDLGVPTRAVVFGSSSESFRFSANVISGTRRGIGYRNTGSFQPDDGCNVFWDNPSGHFSGYTPQPTDRIADPLFCDPDAGVFTVREDSPCIPGGVPGCGQIGAWGEGCGIVSVQPTSWGRIKNLYREGDAR